MEMEMEIGVGWLRSLLRYAAAGGRGMRRKVEVVWDEVERV